MIVTVEWMADNFGRLNDKCFGGNLETPRFALSKSRTRLGSLSYKAMRGLFRTRISDYTLRLSVLFDMTPRQAEDVLLHEMIHLYIAQKNIHDRSAHGPAFRKMMDHINQTYGYSISVTAHASSAVAMQRKKKISPRLVLLLTHETEGCIISVVNSKYMAAVERTIKSVKAIKWHQWYRSTDEYYLSFPQVRSLRGRKVSSSEFEERKLKLEKESFNHSQLFA